ncbi:MAG: AraC family transcriptional regulator [Chloroflexi bacterium]|nr:MAG: AraC family transcriptional regulator [Chloroflexota bacterium]RPI96023.1 MAG: AraC family transcriptional regulator [Chloroflexota bacterium]
MGSNKFRVLKPSEILKGEVECFILNEFTGEEGVAIKTFPSGIPGIVFHYNDGRPAIENIFTQSGRTFSPPTLFLYGPGTQSSVMNFGKGLYTVIQVILKPHALKALFGINALTLKAGAVELSEFSTEDINEQLMDARSEQERVTLLTDFLADKLEQAKTRDDLIEESLHLIHKSAGTISVKSLLEHLNISERQFERRFCQTVGISPVSYIRIRRFNEALRLMKTRRYDTLTEVAYALNFHDQSHFIRDIKTFTGVTPGSLSQKVDDFYHNQAGYSSV